MLKNDTLIICPLPQLSHSEPNNEINLQVGFTVQGIISLSNAITLQLKRLPKISAIDPLYTPTAVSDNMITIYGSNFAADTETFLIIDQFWKL